MQPRADEVETHNRSRVRRFLPTIVVGSALIAVAVYGIVRPAPKDTGTNALAFDLPELIGNGTVSSGDLEGRVVVLNFWASWCAPCRREMPALEHVWQDFRDRGVTIVGVDVRDVPSDARAFAAEVGVTYPLVRDEDEVLVDRLHAVNLPQTFFLGRDGRLAGDQILGETTTGELSARLEQLLEEGA